MERHDLRPVISEHDAVVDHDHLAIQLALLAHLYNLAATPAGSQADIPQAWAAAHQLLHTHIRPWAIDYLRWLEEQARFAPYTTIAYLVRRVLTEASSWPAATLTLPPQERTMLTVYTTTSCGYCRRLKTQLDSEGILYTEVDIEQDGDAAELVMEVNNGNQVVPTVVFADGTAMTNPGVLQVKQHLSRTT